MNDLIYNDTDTIAAISTPPGSGGIAVIRLSGPQAFDIAARIWKGHSLAAAVDHSAHLGTIQHNGQTIDRGVATVFRRPRSYTGEDTIEFAVHGSVWIQSRLIDALTQCGARHALPGEFTRRAYINRRLDLTQAEAVADLINARTADAHQAAMRQMRGHLSAQIEPLRQQLIHLASLIELELDFTEEDVEFASQTQISEIARSARATMQRLADSFSAGQAIRQGIAVAIVGAPNAGKSSLLNALVDDDRAIVSDIPGTTRDIVEDTAIIQGHLFRFLDTAGLRHTGDTIEQMGIERSRSAARRAHITLYIIDSANPDPDPDRTIIDDTRTIIIANKADIAAVTIPDAIQISARTGEGLDALRHALAQRAETVTAGADSVTVNARHAEALRTAIAELDALDSAPYPELKAEHLRSATDALAAITGTIATETILQSIFQSFCIGK